MRPLSLRLATSLVGALLIGLSLLDAAFLLFSQARVTEARHLTMQLAAEEARALVATTQGAPLELGLTSIAERAELGVALVTSGNVEWSSEPGPVPAELIDGAFVAAHGYELLTRRLVGDAERYLVLRRPLVDSAKRALALQPHVLSVLGLAGVVMLAFGLFFLRRTVQRPLGRLTELVGRHDRAALAELGRDTRDDIGRLGHAIIAMVQAGEEDRRRIAWQLAELQAAHAELEAAQQKLVRAERLAVTGQLAAGLAHEIGNPLAILSGYVELLEGGALEGAELEDTLGRMGRELGRIHTTVRNLLDFSRGPSDDGGPGEVLEAVAHVRALVEPQKRLRGVSVSWPTLREPLWVEPGADALVQLVLNLVLNAADALGQSGQIAVEVETNDLVATLRVADSGPGIPDELRAKVFEPFFTTKASGAGTGLGLSVCERIVSGVGGDIAIEPSSLGGVAFRVTLPLVTSP